MSSYIFYDSSGTIIQAMTGSQDIITAEFAKINTPVGCTAMSVPDGHAALGDAIDWGVSGGKLSQRTAPIAPPVINVPTSAADHLRSIKMEARWKAQVKSLS